MSCRPETCAFNVKINSTGCVNIYASQKHVKPTADNAEHSFTSYNGSFNRVLKFPEMENEQCQNQASWHYSVVPCANDTATE